MVRRRTPGCGPKKLSGVCAAAATNVGHNDSKKRRCRRTKFLSAKTQKEASSAPAEPFDDDILSWPAAEHLCVLFCRTFCLLKRRDRDYRSNNS